MNTRIGPPAKTARLFVTGGSQAVRQPAEFRFEGAEVLIHRDPRSGDVVRSPVVRKSWANQKQRLGNSLTRYSTGGIRPRA